jgi:hypothetical protein
MATARFDGGSTDDDDDDDPRQSGASLMDAIIQRALARGTEHVANTVRTAAGKLTPLTLTLTGLVNDAPEPGVVELLLALPGARPIVTRIPYSAQGARTPEAHQAQVRKLIGRVVRVRVEVDRE